MATAAVNVDEYRDRGFLCGLPVLSAEEVKKAMAMYTRLRGLLPAGESPLAIDWWHQIDKELYDLCMHPVILDYVQDVLGPDFYLWGSQFFAKEPGSGATVPWHQDAFYWPLEPHRAVTVWLACSDSFPENGAMRVIPGTHTRRMKHRMGASATDVLDMETDADEFDESDAVTLTMNAGQCSLHDDNIVHGSQKNSSEHIRCGLTIRFSAGEVKCDTSVWPFFKAYWARGEDKWHHNPVGQPPEGLLTKFKQVTPRTGQR
jgi:chlorinating enzyme